MVKKNKIIPTEEQKKLIEAYEYYSKMCEKYANDTASDGAHEWAAVSLNETLKELSNTGFPYDEIPCVKKYNRKKRREEVLDTIFEYATLPFTWPFFLALLIEEKRTEKARKAWEEAENKRSQMVSASQKEHNL